MRKEDPLEHNERCNYVSALRTFLSSMVMMPTLSRPESRGLQSTIGIKAASVPNRGGAVALMSFDRRNCHHHRKYLMSGIKEVHHTLAEHDWPVKSRANLSADLN
jgi:hypothetical protein